MTEYGVVEIRRYIDQSSIPAGMEYNLFKKSPSGWERIDNVSDPWHNCPTHEAIVEVAKRLVTEGLTLEDTLVKCWVRTSYTHSVAPELLLDDCCYSFRVKLDKYNTRVIAGFTLEDEIKKIIGEELK